MHAVYQGFLQILCLHSAVKQLQKALCYRGVLNFNAHWTMKNKSIVQCLLHTIIPAQHHTLPFCTMQAFSCWRCQNVLWSCAEHTSLKQPYIYTSHIKFQQLLWCVYYRCFVPHIRNDAVQFSKRYFVCYQHLEEASNSMRSWRAYLCCCVTVAL